MSTRSNQQIRDISAIITNLVLSGIDDIVDHIYSQMNLVENDTYSIQVAILTALKLKNSGSRVTIIHEAVLSVLECMNVEQYRNIELSRPQIEALAENTANASMIKSKHTPCEEINIVTKMKDITGKDPNILTKKDSNNETKIIAKTKSISVRRIKKVSSTIADFVLSGVEITDEIISFMASELVLSDNSNKNKSIVCSVSYHHRVFTLMATLAAKKVKYLGMIDRYTIKGTAMSVLECINLEWYQNRTFDGKSIESIAESAALTAMKHLYHSEEESTMKESSTGLISKDSLLATIKFPSCQRFSIWDKFVNLYSRSSSQLNLEKDIYSRIPKVVSKYSHISISKTDSMSTVSCLSDANNSYSETFSLGRQHSSTSKMSKKKASLAKEVECLTSLIVDEIHNANSINEEFISKVFVKYVEMKRYHKIKLGLNYSKERVFLELAVRAVANVDVVGGDNASMHAAASSVLVCRHLKRYRNLQLSPYELKRMARSVALMTINNN